MRYERIETPWTVGGVSFGTLTAAVIHSGYHGLPLTRYGAAMTWEADIKEGRANLVHARETR